MKPTKIILTLFLFLISVVSMAQHELSDSDKAALQERVKQKVDEFVHYLGNIVNKDLSDAQRQNSVKSAIELFVGKGERWSIVNDYGEKEYRNPVRMQISSVNRNYSSWLSMKKYLQNQYNNIHKYGKVVIESADVVRVDNINRVGDGQYEAMAYYCQKYIAFRDGRVVYGDITTKKIKVYISALEVLGSVIWEAKLGDVYVTATKPLGDG
jgi:hypothetical protein